MSTVDFDAIMARYKSLATVGKSVSGPSEIAVERTERELGLKLPPSFVRFLRESGGKRPPFWDVHPLLANRDERKLDFVRANELEHDHELGANPLPAHYYTFRTTGPGDQACFDTSSARPDGEFPVVLWVHDESAEENLDSPLTWPSFVDWLDEELDGLDTE